MFSCNLSPALLAEWLGSFTCYCGNTWVEQIPKYTEQSLAVCYNSWSSVTHFLCFILVTCFFVPSALFMFCNIHVSQCSYFAVFMFCNVCNSCPPRGSYTRVTGTDRVKVYGDWPLSLQAIAGQLITATTVGNISVWEFQRSNRQVIRLCRGGGVVWFHSIVWKTIFRPDLSFGTVFLFVFVCLFILNLLSISTVAISVCVENHNLVLSVAVRLFMANCWAGYFSRHKGDFLNWLCDDGLDPVQPYFLFFSDLVIVLVWNVNLVIVLRFCFILIKLYVIVWGIHKMTDTVTG